jgi:diguanylate cyclase (GGDEF)-like protein/PAS domain S-box-containing protein
VYSLEKLIWFPFFMAGALVASVGVYAWLRRGVTGALTLACICAGSAWWSVSEGLLYFGFDQSANVFVTKIQYLGMVWMPALIMLFPLSIYYRHKRNLRYIYLIAFAAPAFILVMAWTNEYHWLLWTEYGTVFLGALPMLSLKHGPIFWVFVSYAYICLGLAGVFLIRWFIISASIFRAQAGVLLAALGVVWMGNIIYVTGLSPVPNIDITPLTFSIASVVTAFGFFRYQLLDVVPVAKTEVFNSMLDGVVVLDENERLIDLNPAAEKILTRQRDIVVGQTAEDVFRNQPDILSMLVGQDLEGEVCLRPSGSKLTYELRIATLMDRNKHRLGRILVWRDITQRKDLEEKLFRLATTDELTSISNRRSFMVQGRTWFSQARRHKRPLAVLALDLDNFKTINDRYGHHVGDMVLMHFAKLVSKNQRAEDVFGRLGGEEFGLILSEAGAGTALSTAERLRGILAESPLKTDQGPVSVTVSIGVAELKEADKGLEDILRRADMALYQAKSNGRNKVVSAEA